MVRYFLTDLRGNPIYSFAQRLRRNNRHHQHHAARVLSHQLLQLQQQQQQHPSLHMGTTSDFITTTLVCMVRNRNWEEVLKRVVSHPAEIHVVDADTGNTVLHAACRLNPPSDVVRVLATAVTCRHANHEGATPLHIAASHRCSAAALQALLDVCRSCATSLPSATTTTTAITPSTNTTKHTDSLEDPPLRQDSNKHTSPTADLSNMGRAPIHYACMSFRGVEMDAFRLLLDETLQEGNVWVWDQPQEEEEDDDEDLLDVYSSSALPNNNSSSNKWMEENEEHDDFDLSERDDKFHYEFENELDKDLYQQQQTSCADDLTVDESKKNEPIKVLVNVMGMKDATGQTPLGLLFRRYRERVRCVINTVDRLRRESHDNPDRAALVAAVRVHADLGELWEKARWIVARLTEERLQREQETEDQANNNITQGETGNEPDSGDPDCKNAPTLRLEHEPPRQDATSRRATFYGGSATSSAYDTARFAEPPSPAEAAVAQEAASWAVEQHRQVGGPPDDDILPLAPNVSTGRRLGRSESPPFLNNNNGNHKNSTGRHFRIVHASVGLTGYGCPPELIRLAISIHPHQVTEMDDDGNLPLHIAVTAASYLATAHAAATRDDVYSSPILAAAATATATASDNSNNADDHSVISDAAMSFFSSATVSQTTNPFDKVIKILLQQYPEAARMPQGKTGRLPLVLAVESGRRTWADGIRTLLNAYPPALHNKKVIEPVLYPSVLALVANNGMPGSCAFDFAGSGIIDLMPVVGDGSNEGGRAGCFRHRPRSKRAIRQETCSRTTLFELLRTKPEWLTRGYDDDDKFMED